MPKNPPPNCWNPSPEYIQGSCEPRGEQKANVRTCSQAVVSFLWALGSLALTQAWCLLLCLSCLSGFGC